ncbi:MAG: hypothetical protein JW912_01215 [Sedimentisphaerales bacterium]|nr:hypothetical protein [Sedimentisphaerales bacterium]
MDSESINQNLENENKYKFAGYCAIASAVLYIPACVIPIVYEIPATSTPVLLPFIFIFNIVQVVCSLYAFKRFKDYLNENYDFHTIDKLVMPIIILCVAITVFSLSGYIVPQLDLLFMVLMAVTGIIAVIVLIFFSVFLLRLEVSLNGLLKPYAYTTIVMCICFIIFFLIPIGMILASVTDFILGIILLKPAEEPTVEFV